MRFHLLHFIGDPTVHMLSGYNELIDTLEWGLTSLGHQVTRAVNRIEPGAINIAFGSYLMPIEALEQLPADSVVYNLEQLRGARKLYGTMDFCAKTFQIWDYSPFNSEFWETFDAAFTPRLVPVGYAPVLERINRPVEQEIDVLIYGMPNSDRLILFDRLSHAGLSVVFVAGLYGAARDELIARSKVVANRSYFTSAKVFEVVRASYLMANRKAVASVLDDDTVIEDDIRAGIAGLPDKELVQGIVDLVGNEAARKELEQRGYEQFSKRDIRMYLERVLDT
ncbi:hypothetical protein [Devosia sp.]|uniref:hypothetical protein n=1 Tax=Devosia sp. TaxID=1871048 RepID=UPI003BABFE9D